MTSRHQQHHPKVTRRCPGCWGWECDCGTLRLTRADGFKTHRLALANATNHLITSSPAR